tara:strand:- start:3788 stop:4108 length:321 start_codon:yes stop_codon:yes gene_type:complete
MFAKFILRPDKSNKIIKLYHKSNKIIIPFLIPSLLLKEDYKIKKYFDIFNIYNLGFHSFISFSTIVTDYHKKIPFINNNLLRILNFKCHGFIVLVLSYQLYKNIKV